jgi:ADP-ribose pyrophosphatase YjhB (NUDIX family)
MQRRAYEGVWGVPGVLIVIAEAFEESVKR